jgi:hypothetical protein
MDLDLRAAWRLSFGFLMRHVRYPINPGAGTALHTLHERPIQARLLYLKVRPVPWARPSDPAIAKLLRELV